MPKLIDVVNEILKKKKANLEKLDEAKAKLEELEKEETKPEFKNSIEHINNKVELKIQVKEYENIDHEGYNMILSRMTYALFTSLREKDKNEIDKFLNETFKDPNRKLSFVDMLKQYFIDIDPRYRNKNLNDFALKDYIHKVSYNYVIGKEKEVFEFLEKYVSDEKKNEIIESLDKNENKEIHLSLDLVNNAKTKLDSNPNLSDEEKSTIKGLLDEFDKSDVTIDNKEEMIAKENVYETIKNQRSSEFAKYQINELKVNDLYQIEEDNFDITRFKYSDKVLNNEDNIKRLEPTKFKLSDDTKKVLKNIYLKLKEKGLLNDNQSFEEKQKNYAFKKFVDSRNKIIKQIKNEDFLNLEENIKEFKQNIKDLEEMYEYIRENLKPNMLTIPGNMSNYRESYVPVSLKNDLAINACINGLVLTFSIIDNNKISIDEFLDDPVEIGTQLSEKGYEKFNVDSMFSNESYDYKILSIMQYDTAILAMTSRLMENVYYSENEEDLVKNSIAYSTYINRDNAVRADYKLAMNYLSFFRNENNAKTVLNLLVAKDKGIAFSKLYGGKHKTFDGLREIESSFDTKQYILDNKISAEDIYNNALNLMNSAFKKRREGLYYDQLGNVYAIITDSLKELVKLDLNISYETLLKINRFASNPFILFGKNINNELSLSFDRAKLNDGDIIKVYQSTFTNKVNQILNKYQLASINSDDVIIKTIFDKVHSYSYKESFPYEGITKNEVKALFNHLETLNKNIEHYDQINNAIDEIFDLSTNVLKVSKDDLAFTPHINTLKIELKYPFEINKSKEVLQEACKKLDISFDQLDRDILTKYKMLFDKSNKPYFKLEDELEELFNSNLKTLLNIKYSINENNFKVIYETYSSINKELMQNLFNKESMEYQLKPYDENLEKSYLQSYMTSKSIDDVVNRFKETYKIDVSLKTFKDPKTTADFDFDKFYLDKFKVFFDMARKKDNKSNAKQSLNDFSVESFYAFKSDFDKLLKSVYKNYSVKDDNLGKVFDKMSEKDRITYLEELYGVPRIIDVKDSDNLSYYQVLQNLSILDKKAQKDEFKECTKILNDACMYIVNEKVSDSSKNIFIASYKNVYKTMHKIHNTKWFTRMLSDPKQFFKERSDLKALETRLSVSLDMKKDALMKVLLKSKDEFVGLKNKNSNIDEFKKNKDNKYRIYSYNDMTKISSLITQINNDVKSQANYSSNDKFDIILRENTKKEYVFENLFAVEQVEKTNNRFVVNEKVEVTLNDAFDMGYINNIENVLDTSTEASDECNNLDDDLFINNKK